MVQALRLQPREGAYPLPFRYYSFHLNQAFWRGVSDGVRVGHGYGRVGRVNRELEVSSKENTSTWAGPEAIYGQMALDRFQLSDFLNETTSAMLLPIPHPSRTPTFQLQAPPLHSH